MLLQHTISAEHLRLLVDYPPARQSQKTAPTVSHSTQCRPARNSLLCPPFTGTTVNIIHIVRIMAKSQPPMPVPARPGRSRQWQALAPARAAARAGLSESGAGCRSGVLSVCVPKKKPPYHKVQGSWTETKSLDQTWRSHMASQTVKYRKSRRPWHGQ